MLDFAVSTPGVAKPGSSTSKLDRAVSLDRIPAGQLATITEVQGDWGEIARLAEMGLHRGIEVVVVRNGITSILQLNHHRICVRLSSDLAILAIPFSSRSGRPK